jgi:tetratricopeptide (TPR) repeat protein
VTSTPKRVRWIAAVSFVVLLAGLLVYMRQRQQEQEQQPQPQQQQQQQPPQPPKQLVVLRLRNVSKDPSLQPLCDGLTELLTNKLTQVAQLEGRVAVVPASEVIKENKEGKEEVTSAKDALRVFGAALVVEGSFQRMGGQVRVSFSLIDTAKQTSVDAGAVTVPEESLSELNDLFLSRASEMLKVHLSAERRRALPVELPKNTGAYELYLEGRYLQRYDRLDTLDNAIDFFQKAVAKDSTYALGYAGLAEAYLRKYNATKADELISRARYNAQRAIELNPSLAPVHYAMGLIHAANGDYELAIDSFDRSIKIQPESNAYREKANAYDHLNKPLEAEANYRRAIETHPEYWAGYRDLAAFFQNHGRLDEALPRFEKVVELTPDNYNGWANLGGLYLRMKNPAKALEYFERANAITPTWGVYNNLGTAFFLLKRDEDAVEMYKKAIQLLPTYAPAWGGLGDVYRRMPKSREAMRDAYAHAIKLTEKELLVNPRDGRTWAKIAMWRVATDKKKALKEIREALHWSPDESFVVARAASVYAQSGMHNQALTALERAIDLGYPLAELGNWPPLEQLMQDARFKAFMEARKSSPVQPSNK